MTISNDVFDEPYIWAPRLCDILHNRADPDIGDACSAVGFDKLVVPATCTYVTARLTDLTMRFNERYMFRRINQETLVRWQIRLQNRMDEIVEEMDRAYRLYATTTSIDDVVRGSKVTYGHLQSTTGTDSTSGTDNTTVSETPNDGINQANNYASSVSKSSASNTLTHNTAVGLSGTDTTQVTGPEILEGVNYSIKSFVDIDTLFIEQFENNFLNIFD